ncbi:RlpA-like double-psi beta-barrel-protein domain-containing protein-containing protein [Lipomyces tetrasporus]|uniref:RlpA-like double-psi beta-barrel-protein domain-containing protein-containing protein n=1 Tax=Lipomyces tetrasporus TaxID=54092 RepID=A0AAD7VPJ6_9ASCO|nr:RlpA-like double-psi beta-barrel-protein domain-containing protein-containing protein [Lipomyces tetrasporus]KAJ8097882.1 RlpA-like double-psi beta-barrel-protein domain-containing protein-containing protein [Lipomyces tetrasporus]
MRFLLTILTLASAAFAAPFDKRAVSWVTVTENVDYVETVTMVQTIVVYATAVDDPVATTSTFATSSVPSVEPTSSVVYQQNFFTSVSSDISSSTISIPEATTSSTPEAEPTTSSTYIEPSTSSYVEPETTTSTYVQPEPTPLSVYVEPTTSSYVEPQPTTSSYVEPEPTTSSAYVEPTTTSVYVEPTTTEGPTSTYVEQAASSTEASVPAVSSTTSSGGSGSYSGEGTFYSTGLGSCGITSTDSDYIVAISHTIMDADSNGNPNANPLCGKTITAYRDSSSVKVTVVDTCPGCAEYDLDFSPTAFGQLGQESEGRIPITWSWDD